MRENFTSLTNKETRGAPRYPVVWPIELEDGTGRTFNISTSGMYVECDVGVAEGNSMRYSVLLPEHNKVADKLQCFGRVVRVEKLSNGLFGVGIQLEDLQFNNLNSLAS